MDIHIFCCYHDLQGFHCNDEAIGLLIYLYWDYRHIYITKGQSADVRQGYWNWYTNPIGHISKRSKGHSYSLNER